jgi:hypothetical protein
MSERLYVNFRFHGRYRSKLKIPCFQPLEENHSTIKIILQPHGTHRLWRVRVSPSETDLYERNLIDPHSGHLGN